MHEFDHDLALRILRMSESSQGSTPEHKSSVGRGNHRIDASRNLWDGSGLKIDSASTDVAWGHGRMALYFMFCLDISDCLYSRAITTAFSNKILTSARNGELIMWDLNKSGPTKYGELPDSCWLFT